MNFFRVKCEKSRVPAEIQQPFIERLTNDVENTLKSIKSQNDNLISEANLKKKAEEAKKLEEEMAKRQAEIE